MKDAEAAIKLEVLEGLHCDSIVFGCCFFGIEFEMNFDAAALTIEGSLVVTAASN